MVNGQDANGNPDDSALKMFKRRFFKCTNIKYNSKTGLISELAFEEIDVGEIPDY